MNPLCSSCEKRRTPNGICWQCRSNEKRRKPEQERVRLRPEVRDLSDFELAWLVGLLEGEGTFSISTSRPKPNGGYYRYPRVRVTMTDQDVVEHVAKLFGGTKVHFTHPPSAQAAGHAPQWATELQGKKAVILMERVLPYMGNRRQARIRELLDPDYFRGLHESIQGYTDRHEGR